MNTTTPPQSPPPRITQRRIAELAGVSQATVSLVLNGKADALTRIPESTRQRVMEVIRETTYVADPAARRLAGAGNRIIGVFTYEPAFPNASLDFYAALLTGIESRSEQLGCDLLLFTSAPVVDGARSLFHEKNRLRLADGCLLLGREMDGDELARLLASGFPFVAVGRRETPGVPYVAADYVSGTAELVRRAWAAGHRRFAYLHEPSTGESVLDRIRGLREELQRLSGDADVHPLRATDGSDLETDWAAVRAADPTVLFVESPAHALTLAGFAARDGIRVPDDLSMVVLADPSRTPQLGPDFTRLSPPRIRLGAEAIALLTRILDPADFVRDDELRITLPCAITDGATLVAPRPADHSIAESTA
jgi:DNA-binding LacI/PurR family transcriptional regulator